MKFLSNFFGGLSIAGYAIVGLGTVLLGSWVVMWFMANNIEGLNEELGAQKAAVELLVNTNIDNQKSLNEVSEQLYRCTEMRANADQQALKAIQELALRTKEAYKLSDERKDEIVNLVEGTLNECIAGATVPPRVTELLIDAASSANQGAESP